MMLGRLAWLVGVALLVLVVNVAVSILYMVVYSHLIDPGHKEQYYHADLDLAEIKSLLFRVSKSIHQQPNRVKYVMNSFVIAVACYVKPLHKLAVDTANGIGKVAVDLVGACKIPFAPDHIKKFEARSAIGKKRKSPKC